LELAGEVAELEQGALKGVEVGGYGEVRPSWFIRCSLRETA
jgi:hypothetical protein